uniref:Uncharacterized protein n=1 Tax=Arundo donax TaxID=35708 RepID=A0A0A9ABZ6_ARUDO
MPFLVLHDPAMHKRIQHKSMVALLKPNQPQLVEIFYIYSFM